MQRTGPTTTSKEAGDVARRAAAGIAARALAAALALGGTAAAQETPAPAAPQLPPCSTPEHRQFDFWLGEWTVTDAAGAAAGTNRIEKILGGCVLHERWQGAGGVAGESFNIYQNGRWHQFWVDAAGRMLRLEGGLRDGEMTLSGERLRSDGKTVRDEITWQKLPHGRVRQQWRVTADGGQTWQEAFEGLYSPAGARGE